MNSSDFVRTYSKLGLLAWEAAAIELARQGQLTPRAWVPITLSDGANTATIYVMNDVLAVGPPEDSVRLPLTPQAAQTIANFYGWILPTPWINYQMYRHAPIKLSPESMTNLGANLEQYAAHSRLIDQQIREVLTAAPRPSTGPELVSGAKKLVVVSNLYQPGKVLIQGWYRPPPAPDVYDDRTPIGARGPDGKPHLRQPVQPHSNLHSSFYVDYSHGIQPIYGLAEVHAPNVFEGVMPTEDLYRHPILSRLVSNEGAVRVTRYPTKEPVRPIVETPAAAVVENAIRTPTDGIALAPTIPSTSDGWLAQLHSTKLRKS